MKQGDKLRQTVVKLYVEKVSFKKTFENHVTAFCTLCTIT